MAPPAPTIDAREPAGHGHACSWSPPCSSSPTGWPGWPTAPSWPPRRATAYTQFEDAFPLADGFLALCLVAASYCLLTVRRAALFWLLAGGGAGIYLFCMDVLYDLQHGVWGKGGNGLVELAINLVTLGLSVFVLRWAWTRRDALLSP